MTVVYVVERSQGEGTKPWCVVRVVVSFASHSRTTSEQRARRWVMSYHNDRDEAQHAAARLIEAPELPLGGTDV